MSCTKRLAIFALASFSTFLLGVLVTRVDSTWILQPREPSAWEVLLSFENQDLEGLNGQSTRVLEQAVVVLTGHEKKEWFSFEPKLFRRILNTNGEQRYILVEEAPLVTIPGNTDLRVHVFDTAGRLLKCDESNGGYRTVVTGMKIRKLPEIDQETLVVNGEYCLGGSPSEQFYVLIGNQITLVYLTLNGQFDSNNYNSRHMTIGPLIQRSTDDWENALHSGDEAEVLSALLWFGGIHWSGEPPPYDDDKEESEKVSSLISRERVQRRLVQLSQSENLWIRRAAESIVDKK